ncbi:thiamine-phosphate kinase [Hydrogenophaga crassostreae]|uniref:Thiamine-monophosphate kinase n=1 Tax=Hydrogenophaga crassostreae TaxID=1763535 RepID=A0A167GHL6_9BURK|nr:thiamine-phosphate kinase [Hydrogenophaga crassostreae]AOW15012.1 thiamine-phosphate kinase [Hydrogenophaga crassostreae]OAD39465.1 thiamine-phosphate kinase [Hydrogenophaga crassostreae]
MSQPTRPTDAPAPGEFGLIARHFKRPGLARPVQVALGIGDDCALLTPTPGHQLAISSDMLVQGRHFFPDVDPASLGHKALAVNLSDLAAMGASPLGFTLALALPEIDDVWLAAFASGLFGLAEAHACPLVGGDTTRGPLNICVTVFGEVRPDRALRRDAARPGHDIYLSGCTGEARLALALMQNTSWATENTTENALKQVRTRLERPSPRLAMGQALAAITQGSSPIAAIDISDGVAGDLGHILAASGTGAELHWAELPVAPALAHLPRAWQEECLLRGGDDYELVFTASPGHRDAIVAAAKACHTSLHRIGQITAGPGLTLLDPSGQRTALVTRGFDHFA